MRAPAHKMTGLAAGVMVWALAGAYLPLAWLAIPAGWLGGNAPDKIEWLGSHRWIKHRTLTHWLPLWLALLAAGIARHDAVWASTVTGYAAGGLTHLLFDLPNPMGVPIFTPVHRLSLRWWHSGDHDGALSLACALIAAGLVWIKYHGPG